jgi:glycosyltransferase involved in cell wall biosynthesis
MDPSNAAGARRRRLLVLSFFPCFHPPRSGGESRLYHLYAALAERFEVVLLSTTDQADAVPPERLTYAANFVECRLPRGPAYASVFEAARAAGGDADVSAVSVGAAGGHPAALHAALLRHHAWADVIVHESPFTLPYDLLAGLDGKPRVYSSHNAEAALMRAMHPGARSAPIHALADSCERALANIADLVMVCAADDLPELERTAGRPLPRIHVAPNGASEPWPPRAVAAVARRLLFVGSRHAPNVEAARFLVDDVMPRLPQLQLHVAGACLPQGGPAPNVVCHGEVSAGALADLLAASDVALNPMRSGGGSNLKVLDWMSAGLPIVATPFGMRGAFAEPGRHYVAAEREQFTDAVAALAADPEARARLSAAGAALVRERLTWGAVAKDAGEALASLRPRRRAPPALWVDDAEPDATAAALLQALGEPAVVLRRHAGERIERRTDGDTTVIRIPAGADEIARGLYDALRRGARRILVRSESWAEIAASFGEPYDFAPAPGPMTRARTFCARNAARLAAASDEDAAALSAVRTDRGGPLPVIASAAQASRLDPPPPSPRRMLVVTYRWTEPPLGGAEVLLRELLARLDAEGGWDVDVVAPDVGSIANDDRFACVYGGAQGLGSAPGLLRTRWRRFPLASSSTAIPEHMERAWEVQAEFESAAAADPLMAEAASRGPRLLAGWWRRCFADGKTFRWTTERATLHAGAGGRMALRGEAPRRAVIVVSSGSVTASLEVEGAFEMQVELPAGPASIRCDARRRDWPEMGPAGLRVTHLSVGPAALIDAPSLAEEAAALPFAQRVALLDRAARATRFRAGTEITRLRGPHAPELVRWLGRHAADYDVVVAQNCVFRPAIEALAIARAKGVPSVFLPHIHLDDDFYHFPDVDRAFRDATVSLVSPRAARDALARTTGADVRHFAAGGVAAEEFSAAHGDADVEAYRRVLPSDGRPELLVLGRKAQAKNWRTALEARHLLEMRGAPARVVLIGPDDDGEPVADPGAAYLGPQPRQVVRGALRSAAVLLNMSTSESFGIVLLEAWLGGCPVIARRGGAFADLVQDGVQGFLAGDAEEAAARAATLLADPALRARMVAAGRETALGLSWSRLAQQLRSVCDELADRGRVRSEPTEEFFA